MKLKRFFTGRLFLFLLIVGIQVVLLLFFLFWFSDRLPAAEAVLFACSLILTLHIINKRQDPAYKMRMDHSRAHFSDRRLFTLFFLQPKKDTEAG